MNLNDLLPLVLSLSIGIERVLELVWDFLETNLGYLQVRRADPDFDYVSFKRNIVTLMGMAIGLTLGGLSSAFGIQLGMENSSLSTRLALGFIGGALAPYSHQLVEFLYQSQKLAQFRQQQTVSNAATQSGTVSTIVDEPDSD